MAREGMDSGLVRELAARMDQTAGQLDQLIGSVEATVGRTSTEWYGADQARFHDEWNGTHRPALTALLQDVRTLATVARTNADQQDIASSSAGVAGLSSQPLGDLTGTVIEGLGVLLGTWGGVGLVKDLLHVAHTGALDDLTKSDRVLGAAGGALALGVDTAALIHDLRTGGVSNQSYNDELNMMIDGAGIAATAVGGPLAGMAVTGIGIGVSALESYDPALTADAFKLTPVGVLQDGIGTAVQDIRHGDYNPIDIVGQVGNDYVHTAADLDAHAAHDVDRAFVQIGSAEVHAAKAVGDFASGGVRALTHWL